jgi:hypothetical protein
MHAFRMMVQLATGLDKVLLLRYPVGDTTSSASGVQDTEQEMGKGLSLRLHESLYEETNRVVRRLHIPRNAYISQAIASYNRLHERRDLARRLREESRLVHAESRTVLAEFERLPDSLP